jgi:ABC-type nickel/cobalt efflux system permease component RcnA
LSRMKWIIYARKRDVIGEDINDELLGTLWYDVQWDFEMSLTHTHTHTHTHTYTHTHTHTHIHTQTHTHTHTHTYTHQGKSPNSSQSYWCDCIRVLYPDLGRKTCSGNTDDMMLLLFVLRVEDWYSNTPTNPVDF